MCDPVSAFNHLKVVLDPSELTLEIDKCFAHLEISNSQVAIKDSGQTINTFFIEPLEYTEFDLVIADEAHKIRKLSSQLSKGIEKINRKRFWALTGTPIENNVEDLISLLKHINSKKFQHLTKNRNPVLLQESAKPNVLRRLKKQVLKDLPEVIEQNIPVQLSQEQEKEYLLVEKNKSRIVSETGSYFSVLSKLRTICEGNGFKENAKVNKTLELIEKIAEMMRR